MTRWFRQWFAHAPSIDSLKFDVVNCKFQGETEDGQTRTWMTPEQDAISLHLFKVAPDLPSFAELAAVRAFYESQLASTTSRLIECDVSPFATHRAIRIIIKVPQSPHGRIYQGAFTLPFRDFSYVVKVQCPEVGTTGIREAMLMEKHLSSGSSTTITGGRTGLQDWNPDSSEYDAQFPQHPVSRLRRIMGTVAASAHLAAAVARLPVFELPEA